MDKIDAVDAILQFLSKICVVIFFVGVVGSMVVVVISFVEDLELLIESDDDPGDVDAPKVRA